MLRQRISLINQMFAFKFCSVLDAPKTDPYAQLKDHVLNYQHNETLQLTHQNISYNNDIAPALEIYKNLGFNKNHLSRLWKNMPSSLMISKDESQNDIHKLSDFLKENLGMDGREIRTMMFKHPKILKYSNVEIGKFIQAFREELKMSNDQIKRQLFFYPLVIEGDFRLKVFDLKVILTNYTSMTDEQVGEFSSRFPYLLEIHKTYIEKNIKTLINIGIKPIEIQKMLNSTCEFLALNPPYFFITVASYLSIVKDKQKLKELLILHPRLLVQCPHTMIIPKINIFLGLGLDHEQIGQILQAYPEIFLKSIGSMKLKLQYLKRFFKHVPIEDPFFPQVLTYKYWEQIRPRGELLRAKGVKFNWKEALVLNNEDFLKKYNFSPEALQKLIDEKPNSFEEIDYKKKFFTKYFKNSGRYAQD